MFGLVLPTGFRFHPTDQELFIHYLRKRVSSSPDPHVSIIADVNIYQFDPWDLPGKAMFGESEWFFYSPRERKYRNGGRPNRAAASGYWKATGIDKPIFSNNKCLGVKKSLVFYKGKAPKGTKTEWMMLEYRLLVDNHHHLHKFTGSMRLDDWVLCRVRQKATQQPKQEVLSIPFQERSPVDSIPNALRYLQGQESTATNNNLGIFDYCFQNPFLAQLECEETNEQGLIINCQEGSLDNSFSTVSSSSQTLKDPFESIKIKSLSIGNLEDLVPVSPERMPQLSPFDSDIGSISQVSSPNAQVSCSYGFTGYKF